jgi:hypothetical protein
MTVPADSAEHPQRQLEAIGLVSVVVDHDLEEVHSQPHLWGQA